MKLLLSIVQTSSIEVVPYFRHSASLRRNSGQSVSSRRPNAPMPSAPLYVIFSGTQRPQAAGQDSERGIVESSRRPKAPMPAARASFSSTDVWTESHLPSALISVQIMPTLIFISASGVSTHGPKSSDPPNEPA